MPADTSRYSEMGPGQKVVALQSEVFGVTDDQCQLALRSHNWDVAKSIKYLKVSFGKFFFYYIHSCYDIFLKCCQCKISDLTFPDSFFSNSAFSFQIEQLYQSGICASKEECERSLQSTNWDLESSSRLLLQKHRSTRS